MTAYEAFEKGKQILECAQIAEAGQDARLLLLYVLDIDTTAYLMKRSEEIDEEKRTAYFTLIERRKTHIPLQHLTGNQEFMGLDFKVAPAVLIPRQDTEILVEEVLKILKEGDSVLDLCTGSGCIIISLCHYKMGIRGTGADISKEALQIAKENAKINQTEICFIQSDLFENIKERYSVIVSNPPYIRTEEIEKLMPEVREHDPLIALDGKEDGLYFYRSIIKESKGFLKKEGRLFLEIGCDQAAQVTALLQTEGFEQIKVIKDYAGLDRVVHAVVMEEETCLIN